MTFKERILGVFQLDPAIFEDVEHDPSAMQQAVIVVAITALLSGAGSTMGGSSIGYAIASVFIAFFGWLMWSVITYAIGTKAFDGTADIGEMLRVIGFAFAPQALAIIPCIGAFIGFFWSLAAGFIAVRQGLDLDNGKTALTIGGGALVYFVLTVSLTVIFGTGRMLGM